MTTTTNFPQTYAIGGNLTPEGRPLLTSSIRFFYNNTYSDELNKLTLENPITESQILNTQLNDYREIHKQINKAFCNNVFYVDDEQLFSKSIHDIVIGGNDIQDYQLALNSGSGYFPTHVGNRWIRGYNGTTATGHIHHTGHNVYALQNTLPLEKNILISGSIEYLISSQTLVVLYFTKQPETLSFPNISEPLLDDIDKKLRFNVGNDFITLSEVNTSSDNPTTRTNVINRLSNYFNGKILTIYDSTNNISENVLINSIQDISFSTNLSALSPYDSGYLPQMIGLSISRNQTGSTGVIDSLAGFNGTPVDITIMNNTNTRNYYSYTVNAYIEQTNIEYTSTVNETTAMNNNINNNIIYNTIEVDEDTFLNNNINYNSDLKQLSNDNINISAQNYSIIDFINATNENLTINDLISTKGSFIQLVSDVLNINSNAVDISDAKIIIMEQLIMNNIVSELTVRELLVIVDDFITLRDNSKSNVDYNSVITDLIRVFDQTNLIDFVDYYVSAVEFLKVNLTASSLEAINKIFEVIINDTFRFLQENTNAYLEYKERAVEFLRMKSEGLFDTGILLQVSDSFTLIDTVNNNVDINIIINEIIKSTFYLKIAGDEYECYAMNLDNKALTRYNNYNFNSFASFNDKYYGLATEGLADLIYTNDDGEEIVSKIKTSFFNITDNGYNLLGGLANKQKQLKYGYFLIKSNGQLGLRVYTDLGSKFDYIIKQDYNDSKFRTTFGSAVKGSMFQVELTSYDDFELKEFQFVPIILSKNI